MKLIVLAATASVSSALGPLAPSVSARDMMPKKLGARWYTGYQTAYPNGAKDMPDAPPESTSATLGDHDPKLFNFWKQINEQDDVYEVPIMCGNQPAQRHRADVVLRDCFDGVGASNSFST
mgnify:CR=1 FL=1